MTPKKDDMTSEDVLIFTVDSAVGGNKSLGGSWTLKEIDEKIEEARNNTQWTISERPDAAGCGGAAIAKIVGSGGNDVLELQVSWGTKIHENGYAEIVFNNAGRLSGGRIFSTYSGNYRSRSEDTRFFEVSIGMWTPSNSTIDLYNNDLLMRIFSVQREQILRKLTAVDNQVKDYAISGKGNWKDIVNLVDKSFAWAVRVAQSLEVPIHSSSRYVQSVRFFVSRLREYKVSLLRLIFTTGDNLRPHMGDWSGESPFCDHSWRWYFSLDGTDNGYVGEDSAEPCLRGLYAELAEELRARKDSFGWRVKKYGDPNFRGGLAWVDVDTPMREEPVRLEVSWERNFSPVDRSDVFYAKAAAYVGDGVFLCVDNKEEDNGDFLGRKFFEQSIGTWKSNDIIRLNDSLVKKMWPISRNGLVDGVKSFSALLNRFPKASVNIEYIEVEIDSVLGVFKSNASHKAKVEEFEIEIVRDFELKFGRKKNITTNFG